MDSKRPGASESDGSREQPDREAQDWREDAVPAPDTDEIRKRMGEIIGEQATKKPSKEAPT
jgi:hypothetical protein